MMQMITGKWLSQAIYAAAELGVADHLAKGPRSSADLATAVGADPSSLHRLLRALAGFGVFTADDQGRFALTPLGETLREGVPGSVRAMSRMMGMQPTWRAWEDIVYSVRTGKSAFEHQNGMNGFEYMKTHPTEAAIFDGAMTSFSAAEIPALLGAYDFSQFDRVVDVAGGRGHLLAAILGANAKATGVLFDLPHAVDGARAFLADAQLASRTQVVAGDFFQSVPAGSGVYVLKHIIHDWNDDACKAILASCRKAMQPTGKLLVIEMVIPPNNEPFFGKLLDLEMLVVTPGGRERTEAEYRAMFAAAGFTLTRTIATHAPVSILEATPA